MDAIHVQRADLLAVIRTALAEDPVKVNVVVRN